MNSKFQRTFPETLKLITFKGSTAIYRHFTPLELTVKI